MSSSGRADSIEFLKYSSSCPIEHSTSFFKSCISYLDNHVQNNGQSKLTLSKNINLDNIYNELYEIINHRNNVFDNIFINKFYIN